MGFVVVAFVLHADFEFPTEWVLVGMVAAWGIRLAIYLFIRNKNTGEDWRYQKWQEEWGKKVVLIAYFRVFILQGTVMWLVSLPLMQEHFELESGWSTGFFLTFGAGL